MILPYTHCLPCKLCNLVFHVLAFVYLKWILLVNRLNIEESLRPPSGKNITTLRIKDTDNHTYVLKMKFSDTIQDVMNYLNELR